MFSRYESGGQISWQRALVHRRRLGQRRQIGRLADGQLARHEADRLGGAVAVEIDAVLTIRTLFIAHPGYFDRDLARYNQVLDISRDDTYRVATWKVLAGIVDTIHYMGYDFHTL